jgi:hypothetical protein
LLEKQQQKLKALAEERAATEAAAAAAAKQSEEHQLKEAVAAAGRNRFLVHPQPKVQGWLTRRCRWWIVDRLTLLLSRATEAYGCGDADTKDSWVYVK